MYPMVEQELSRQAELEARRAGVRARRLHALEAYAGAKAVPDVEVAIREAGDGDVPELMRLAQLDSRPRTARCPGSGDWPSWPRGRCRSGSCWWPRPPGASARRWRSRTRR